MVGQYIYGSSKIASLFSGRYINLLASKNVSSSGKVSLSKISSFVGIWFKLLAELLKQKPQLCYLALTVTGAAFYRDVLIVALLKLFGVKRVYHLHNKGVKRWSDNRVHRLFYHFVFKDVDVILLSKHLYSDIQDFVHASKFHICPNGIPNENPNSKIQIPREERSVVKILFLSNLIESKGVYALIEACSMLKSKGISFQCDFIGGEGDITAERFQAMVDQYNLADQVNFLGKKYDQEKFLAFVSADIFAFPTHYPNECFPLVILEAMQYSLPVISTFEGGIPDVIEDGITGFLVPQKDVEALASKLEFLINNPKVRHQMGAAGRQKFENEFKLEVFENRLTDILQQIIDE
ncbi:glycosyl transferase family 1 [Sunxiuqinia dokdonensis]|uniref:Glycosyl transferase family 1 n=2 Tax=Sunxiuqinia dokdonensis TaxID=1409788 RepID=A0A0L8VEP2_9BACT|nr:glycosyl transferase family 1 [Sunxiuqinia dokdonensis]